MRKHNTQRLIFLVGITIFIASCANYKSPKTISPLAFQSPIEESDTGNFCKPPLPQPGHSAICGILYSTYMNPPAIPQTAFYLMRVVEATPPTILTGPDTERGDLLGVSDNQGLVFMDNVPPGNYYILVWAPYSWIFAVNSPKDLTPRLITLEPDMQYMLGRIYVPWP